MVVFGIADEPMILQAYFMHDFNKFVIARFIGFQFAVIAQGG